MWNYSWVPRLAAVLIWICVLTGVTAAATPHYLITNDDVQISNSISFYTISSTGGLTLTQQLTPEGSGIGGGFFSSYRVAALDNSTQQCVFVSDAFSGQIVGIDVNTLTITGNASGSENDSGSANGIGLAVNNQYLYASYSTSNTIGTFQVQSGCTLTFVNDVTVSGLQSGFIDAMVLHGNMMVVTFGDGSIQSFNISNGTPVPNGDEQNSSAYITSSGSSYPNSVEITSDGHYAIFGDTSTSTVIEVSDIHTGTLTATVPYHLGTPINSSNILLSPDQTLLYVSNNQGDVISAAFFNSATGALTPGCMSGKLTGYVTAWSYLSQLQTAGTGTGQIIYAAEFGGPSSIAMIQVGSNGTKCELKEMTGSPVADPNSSGLLSIGVFPPRSF